MNILGICNTYYQLIAMIQLKLTVLKFENVDLLLSDHSKDALLVVNRLCKTSCFNSVKFLDSKELIYGSHSKIKKIMEILAAVTGNNSKYEELLSGTVYDELIFCNMEISVATIFAIQIKKNKNLKCSRLEEGIISYNVPDIMNPNCTPTGRLRVVYMIRKILTWKNINKCTNKFYCYYPERYNGSLKTIAIPLLQLDDLKLQNYLAEAFGLNGSKLSYPQKYIYFASVGDIEGDKPIGEVNLAKSIAEIVGYDNLLVKVHPRDISGAFEKAGLIVDKNSSIPWEVIQLNYNFSNHVFLTATSGSVLSVNLSLKEGPPTYFLYPMCDLSQNKSASKAAALIKNLFDILNEGSEVPVDRFRIVQAFKEVEVGSIINLNIF